MSAASDGGKGSGRRPGQGFQDGWDRIFGRQPKTCPPCHGDCEQGKRCPARMTEAEKSKRLDASFAQWAEDFHSFAGGRK